MHNLDATPLNTNLVPLQALSALQYVNMEMPSMRGLLCPSPLRARIKEYPELQPIPAMLFLDGVGE